MGHNVFQKPIPLYLNGMQHGFKKTPSLIENGTLKTEHSLLIVLLIEMELKC